MNRQTLLAIIILSVMPFFWHCESRQKTNQKTDSHIPPMPSSLPPSIIIYGSQTCDHCIEFLKQADSARIRYTFKDVEANMVYYNELLSKIQQAKFEGYVSFPVIGFREKIYVNPTFAEFIDLTKDN